MKTLKEIQEANEITIVAESFQKNTLAAQAAACACKLDCTINGTTQTVVADYFIEVNHP